MASGKQQARSVFCSRLRNFNVRWIGVVRGGRRAVWLRKTQSSSGVFVPQGHVLFNSSMQADVLLVSTRIVGA
jgi:hypothetical protein